MKDFLKNKVVTSVIVVATVILAGVAIFTALRLYQLRKQAVTPTEPFAWDCQNYTFSVSSSGVVTINNQSTKDEALQQARVYINDNLVATFDVPALPKGQSATLGTVQVPGGAFSWRVEGTKDCGNSGTSGPVACELLTFTLTQETPTPTPTGTLTPTPTGTLSPTPSPTRTPTPTAVTNTSTPTPSTPIGGGPSSTPTPTTPIGGGPSLTPTSPPGATNTPTSLIAQASPTPGGENLPAAGISLPTIAGLAIGFLIILAAFILAL